MEHTFVQYHTKKLAPLKYPFRGDREESGFVKLKVGGEGKQKVKHPYTTHHEGQKPTYKPLRITKLQKVILSLT